MENGLMSQPTDLLAEVTKRLFAAIFMLLLIILATMTFAVVSNSQLVTPVFVVMGGFIGGFVGLQRRLKDLTVEDLQLISKSFIYTWLSPLVGGVLALLVYVLFLSDLLSGQLFPRFTEDTSSQPLPGFVSLFHQHGASYQDYAKLVFWSFVAGFSERFVTDVIGRFEGTAIRSLPKV
jgi:phosphate/sulfate permease